MRIASVTLAFLGLMLMFGAAACSGTEETTVPFEEGGPPKWWSNKTDEKQGINYGYGLSGGEKSDKLAREAAKANAQQQLAEFISVKVQALLEQYMRDMGAGDAAEASRQTESAMRTLTNQRITGFKIDLEGWDKMRRTYYLRGYLDFDALSKLGEAFKASADLNGALDKVQADRDAFFKRLDDALKDGFDK